MFATTSTFTRTLAYGERVDIEVREPDFVDTVAGTAAWVGEDGAVEVSLDRLSELAVALHVGSRRRGPAAFGIQVTVFTDGTVDALTSAGEAMTAKRATWALWNVARLACTIPEAL